MSSWTTNKPLRLRWDYLLFHTDPHWASAHKAWCWTGALWWRDRSKQRIFSSLCHVGICCRLKTENTNPSIGSESQLFASLNITEQFRLMSAEFELFAFVWTVLALCCASHFLSTQPYVLYCPHCFSSSCCWWLSVSVALVAMKGSGCEDWIGYRQGDQLPSTENTKYRKKFFFSSLLMSFWVICLEDGWILAGEKVQGLRPKV